MHIESPSDQPIIIMTRTFYAPRDVVWTVFTTPAHVVKWYGGHGFANPVCEMDVRPGGRWRHRMRTPDGTEFDLDYVYVEVVRPEKLVWKNADHPNPPPSGLLNVVNTVTLEDAGRRTAWKLVARFDSIADRDTALAMGFTRVITQGSEKLDDVAKGLAPSFVEAR